MCFKKYCSKYNTNSEDGDFCNSCFQDWTKHHHDDCPICYSTTIIKDGLINYNSETKTDCLHWICIDCLFKMSINNSTRCPLCRVNMEEFLNENYMIETSISIYDLLLILNAFNSVMNELVERLNN